MNDIRERWKIAKRIQRAKHKIKEGNIDNLSSLEYETAIEHNLLPLPFNGEKNQFYELLDLERDFEVNLETDKEITPSQQKIENKIEDRPKFEIEKIETKPLFPIPKETRQERIMRQINELMEKAKLGHKHFSEIDEYRLTALKEQLRDLHPRRGRALHLWRKT